MKAKIQYTEVPMLLTHAAANVAGPWTAIENPSELGLIVPPLPTPSSVFVQVARDAIGTGAAILVDKAGTQVLLLASSSGSLAVSSNELGAILGYPFMRVVLGTNQNFDVTFYLMQKVVAGDPYA